MGATYEASASRDGVEVRVVVDLTDEATYADVDEIGEWIGQQSAGIARRIIQTRIDSVPF